VENNKRKVMKVEDVAEVEAQEEEEAEEKADVHADTKLIGVFFLNKI
jgi:hypothetical protein